MYVCRNATSKNVVFVTTSGEISITATGLTSVSATEFTGVAEGWGTDDGYEVINLTGSEIELPSDYSGNVYMLVEDGDSYRFDRIV
jgi:hypothetical protein